MVQLVWFRQDLRIADNPALHHAHQKGPVVGLYVLDETQGEHARPLGAASRWWLHHSLESLAKDLGSLILVRGDPLELVPKLAREVQADGVYWNRCYEPHAISRDTKLKKVLLDDGYDVSSFNGSLLFEPWEVQTKSGGPYKVFSAFWRACQQLPIAPPVRVDAPQTEAVAKIGDVLSDWDLLPERPNWAVDFGPCWQPGESGARKRLEQFIEEGLEGYGKLRDRPDRENVSRLSPHLHFGEISPRQLWGALRNVIDQSPALERDGLKFLSEVGWREFSYHLLYHFPQMIGENWKADFDAYPWQDNEAGFTAWKRGKTGYPIVDAGMRELWATGYMHNRVRMVVASFLVKHLRVDWRKGETYFWDTLVDADLANNVCSWQWVTGSGADAAPYFRIFNPITQGKKFDPDGHYIRRWCPEISRVPTKFIHAPFEAPVELLAAAGVELGTTYPAPIVDHAEARAAALAGYETVKQHTEN